MICLHCGQLDTAHQGFSNLLICPTSLYTPAPPQRIFVSANADLQAALEAVQPGQVLELESDAVFFGNHTLPLRQGDPITVRGVNTTLRSLNSLPALRIHGPTRGWRFEGVTFAVGASTGDIVQVGAGTETSLEALPSDIVFEACRFSAEATAKNGLTLNGAALTVRSCRFEGIKLAGIESHAIVGWNGPGPFLIDNNDIEAGSCGVLFGGAKPSIPDLVPSDITFTRNLVTRPLALQGGPWGCKNLFELKNARRVTIVGNVFEHNWAQGQAGFAIVFTVRANSPDAPWTTIRDVVFESNIVRHSGAGCNILGLDDQRPSAGAPVYPSLPMQDVTLRNNLWYDIERSWGGSPSASWLQISGAPRNLTVERNTAVQADSIIRVSGAPCEGFRFVGNITKHNAYGIVGDSVAGGNATLARYFPNAQVWDNVIAGANTAVYPIMNSYPALLPPFVDAPGGNYRQTLWAVGCDQDALEAAQA